MSSASLDILCRGSPWLWPARRGWLGFLGYGAMREDWIGEQRDWMYPIESIPTPPTRAISVSGSCALGCRSLDLRRRLLPDTSCSGVRSIRCESLNRTAGRSSTSGPRYFFDSGSRRDFIAAPNAGNYVARTYGPLPPHGIHGALKKYHLPGVLQMRMPVPEFSWGGSAVFCGLSPFRRSATLWPY
jgi:hypothetical protein